MEKFPTSISEPDKGKQNESSADDKLKSLLSERNALFINRA